MKKTITIAAMLAVSAMAFADDYNLFVQSTQGDDLAGYKLGAVKKVTFESGKLVVTLQDGNADRTPLTDITRLYFSTKPCQQVTLGDVNDDGDVNVNDISSVASYILGNTPQPFNAEAADYNADGEINVNDISSIASFILSGE